MPVKASKLKAAMDAADKQGKDSEQLRIDHGLGTFAANIDLND